MNDRFKKLRSDLARAEDEFKRKKGDLYHAELACKHVWGDPEAAHIYHPAHTLPGDEPGTMGVDWRGPCHVPATTDQRWRRVCSECGKEEFTTRVKEHVSRTPQF